MTTIEEVTNLKNRTEKTETAVFSFKTYRNQNGKFKPHRPNYYYYKHQTIYLLSNNESYAITKD